jgi:hypothetical protein
LAYLTDLTDGTEELWEPSSQLLGADQALRDAAEQAVRQELNRTLESQGR